MRHRKKRLSLNRFTSWRKATLISISKNLLVYQSIRTTQTKAKAARPLVEKLIALGKKDNLTARRRAFDILQDHKLVRLLFSDIAPLFNIRNTGFCRIVPVCFRRGDGARMVILELTEKRKQKKPVKKEVTKPETKEETPQAPVKPQAKPPKEKKPTKQFLGGLRRIFKKQPES